MECGICCNFGRINLFHPPHPYHRFLVQMKWVLTFTWGHVQSRKEIQRWHLQRSNPTHFRNGSPRGARSSHLQQPGVLLSLEFHRFQCRRIGYYTFGLHRSNNELETDKKHSEHRRNITSSVLMPSLQSIERVISSCITTHRRHIQYHKDMSQTDSNPRASMPRI